MNCVVYACMCAIVEVTLKSKAQTTITLVWSETTSESRTGKKHQRKFNYSITQTVSSITVAWEPVSCMYRNDYITGYIYAVMYRDICT